MHKPIYFRSAGLLLPALLFIFSCKKENVPIAPPTVELLSPSLISGDVFTRIVDIQVKADATTGRSIEKVEFYVDGVLLADKTDFSGPFSCQWEATDKFGEVRKIEARAYDNEDQSGSASINIKVFNAVEKAALPTSRYCFTSEVVDGKIYVIGGFDAHKKLEVYDPVKNLWETKAESNKGHACHASCVINGKIYVFGGDEGFNFITTTEVYDPAANTWTEKAPIPVDDSVGIVLMAAVAHNGKAYLFGGQSTSPGFVQVGEYDPVADSWSTKSFKNVFSPAGVSLNNLLYLSGGCSSPSVGLCSQPGNSFENYDPVSGSFTSRANMLYQHSGHALCVAKGKIFAIGGTPSDNNTQMEVYDPVANTWKKLPDMPTGFINFGCGVVNDKIYIIGSKVYEYIPD